MKLFDILKVLILNLNNQDSIFQPPLHFFNLRSSAVLQSHISREKKIQFNMDNKPFLELHCHSSC